MFAFALEISYFVFAPESCRFAFMVLQFTFTVRRRGTIKAFLFPCIKVSNSDSSLR